MRHEGTFAKDVSDREASEWLMNDARLMLNFHDVYEYISPSHDFYFWN